LFETIKFISLFLTCEESKVISEIEIDYDKKLDELNHMSNKMIFDRINEAFYEADYEQPSDNFYNALLKLDNLVGLKNIKKEVKTIVNLARINKLKIKKGVNIPEISNHMIFLGPPGTGKTTVARIITEIFFELGIVKENKLYETDRSELVSGYVGQTAIKVKSIIDKALNGVLFIDEAYSLSRYTVSNDFGQEAIDTIVKYMEDYRNELIIVMAGYTNEMNHLINSNPGLKSRFRKILYFEKYTLEEQVEIFCYFCKNYGVLLSNEVVTHLKLKLVNNELLSDGSARTIRNMFEESIANQANRLSKIKNPSKMQLSSLIIEDI